MKLSDIVKKNFKKVIELELSSKDFIRPQAVKEAFHISYPTAVKMLNLAEQFGYIKKRINVLSPVHETVVAYYYSENEIPDIVYDEEYDGDQILPSSRSGMKTLLLKLFMSTPHKKNSVMEALGKTFTKIIIIIVVLLGSFSYLAFYLAYLLIESKAEMGHHYFAILAAFLLPLFLFLQLGERLFHFHGRSLRIFLQA